MVAPDGGARLVLGRRPGPGQPTLCAWELDASPRRVAAGGYLRISKWGDNAISVKTILTAFRVSDLGRSLEFYEKFGFREIGRVAFADGSILVMLNLVDDGDVVTLELAYDPKIDSVEVGNGFSHIAVQVDNLESKLADLAEKGVASGELQRPAGDTGPKPALCMTRMAIVSSLWSGHRVTRPT